MTLPISPKPLYVTTFPYLLLTTVGTMFVISNFDSTMLLYMNHLGYTSKNDDSFYVKTVAAAVLGPAFSALSLGHLSNHVGAPYALVVGFFILTFGQILITISRLSPAMLVLGYIISSFSFAFRILNFTIISEIVPREKRTYYMAINQLMVPIGALLGPTAWLLFQTWRGQVVIIPSVFVLDRFSVTFLFSILIALALARLSYTKLQLSQMAKDHQIRREVVEGDVDEASQVAATPVVKTSTNQNVPTTSYGTLQVNCDSNQGRARRVSENVAQIQLSDGSEHSVDLTQYRNALLAFFATLFLCMRFTFAFVLIVFQPALIHKFHADDSEVGRAYWIISMMSFVPPLTVAAVSGFVSDRHILLFGLVLKLIGFGLYLPIFGDVQKWALIIGYMLVVKASMFCVSASISLFTKLLGPFCSGKVIGYLWSFSSFFPAAVQILFSSQIVDMFATWQYAAFSFPVVLSVMMVLWPRGWRLLNSESEYSRLVVQAATQSIASCKTEKETT